MFLSVTGAIRELAERFYDEKLKSSRPNEEESVHVYAVSCFCHCMYMYYIPVQCTHEKFLLHDSLSLSGLRSMLPWIFMTFNGLCLWLSMMFFGGRIYDDKNVRISSLPLGGWKTKFLLEEKSWKENLQGLYQEQSCAGFCHFSHLLWLCSHASSGWLFWKICMVMMRQDTFETQSTKYCQALFQNQCNMINWAQWES